TPFAYFVNDAWQPAPISKARLRANGGEPGDGPDQPVIRRWTSPVSGSIAIEGTLKHNQARDNIVGDGIHARIVSSRLGELASWIANGSTAETKLSGITIEKGDTLDFIVDGRADIENDAFQWAPSIKLLGKTETTWSAAADFRGPEPLKLDIWDRFAHVLLETNEFAFVD